MPKELLDNDRLEAIAQVVHESMRAWQRCHGQEPSPPWADAPEWMHESTLESVRFSIENPDAPHSAQHDQWMAQKVDAGWQFGPEKSETKKTHPMLVSFAQLPDFEKRKDALVRAIALALI